MVGSGPGNDELSLPLDNLAQLYAVGQEYFGLDQRGLVAQELSALAMQILKVSVRQLFEVLIAI
eukprot:CAMPEP_0170461086 /NCGR_PEP_ID=MMETSP0123-20130129/7145_1 /TAXON_ID=182087 /ORGANISM="Favella ehrenbergii, Strain Fehren 1" /LENGTH=63 /DNA_ID=CAMNT_0010726061 /DNA_START=1600 /DNA_END=1791 /DNA_ORIENTATION=+